MLAITRKNLMVGTGYGAFFLVCFVFFAYLSFPYERVSELLVAKVSSTAAPGTKLEIGDQGPHWLTGITFRSVKLQRPAAPGAAPSSVELDKLTVSAAPFTMLFGGLGVHFDAVAGDGEISGSYSAKKTGPARVQAELDALDLGRLALGDQLGIPISGSASGELDVTLSDQPAETQGDVDLRVENLRLGDGKAKVKIPGMAGGLTLETINAGTLELKLSVKEGIATVERMEAKGKDLELSGSGSVRLVRNLRQSWADLTLGVKVNDAYAKKNARTKAMLELMNASLRRFKGPDGMMRFRINGPLIGLRAAPAAPSAAPIRKIRVR